MIDLQGQKFRENQRRLNERAKQLEVDLLEKDGECRELKQANKVQTELNQQLSDELLRAKEAVQISNAEILKVRQEIASTVEAHIA